MTPLHALAWIAVLFVGMLVVAFGVSAIATAVKQFRKGNNG